MNIKSPGVLLNSGKINFGRKRNFTYQIFELSKIGLHQEQNIIFMKYRGNSYQEIRKYVPNNGIYFTTLNLFTCFLNLICFILSIFIIAPKCLYPQ